MKKDDEMEIFVVITGEEKEASIMYIKPEEFTMNRSIDGDVGLKTTIEWVEKNRLYLTDLKLDKRCKKLSTKINSFRKFFNLGGTQ